MLKRFSCVPAFVLAGAILMLLAPCAGAQAWTARATMPGLGRHHPVNFVINGIGYVVTGSTSTSGSTADFYRYDPVLDSWQILPPFPGMARSYAYGGSHGGRGYLGFGFGSTLLADLWRYDPASGWTQLAPLPGAGRTHPAFVVTDDGRIFVGMGGGPAGNLRDFWEYDIATNGWTRRADLPGPARHHPYYFNIGNTPYVGFGHGAGIFKDFYRFDRGTLSWVRLADFPGEGRVAGQQFSWGGKGYVISGDGEDHERLDTGEFHEYDPATDTWRALPAHPGSGRWAPGSFVIGDHAYFMGGQSTTQYERDLWRYDLGIATGVGEIAVDGTAGVDGATFTLYPNPAGGTEVRMLRVPAEYGAAAVRLLGADGRRVRALQNRSGVLSLPRELPAGHYFVQLVAPDGSSLTRRLTVLR